MRARGISVSLGADGAACNNRLDMFDEMRLAATLQADAPAARRTHRARRVWMATREGARALGMEREVGSIEPGKRADLILVGRDGPHQAPDPDPWSTLVYATRGTDVRVDDGRRPDAVQQSALLNHDVGAITAECPVQRPRHLRPGPTFSGLSLAYGLWLMTHGFLKP